MYAVHMLRLNAVVWLVQLIYCVRTYIYVYTGAFVYWIVLMLINNYTNYTLTYQDTRFAPQCYQRISCAYWALAYYAQIFTYHVLSIALGLGLLCSNFYLLLGTSCSLLRFSSFLLFFLAFFKLTFYSQNYSSTHQVLFSLPHLKYMYMQYVATGILFAIYI